MSWTPIAHRTADTPKLRIGDTILRVLLSSEETHGQFSLLEWTLPAGESSPGAHFHKSHDETYLVLEGHLHFQVGDSEVDLEPGTNIFVPRGTLHHFEVLGNEPARFHLITTPGGFERFFEELARLASQGVDDLHPFSALCDSKTQTAT